MIINQEKPEEEWLRNCLKFHPNVPEQNPVKKRNILNMN